MLLGTQRINEAGHLEIGGCDAVTLAHTYGTPLYVMDEPHLRATCRAYREALARQYPHSTVAFAGKAFLNLAMCRIAHQEGLSLDIASGGELFTALQADFPPARIFFHGNYKTTRELETALDAGVGRIVVDSVTEMDQLQAIAARKGLTPEVQVRVAPGVKPQTHTYIQTGQIDSKFGLGIETGCALEGIRHLATLPNLVFRGIHCHIGSQLFGLSSFDVAARMMADFARELRETLRLEVAEINMGGGLGVRYRSSDEPPSIEDYARTLAVALREECARHSLAQPRLIIEPGRGIVGEAGTTLYTVGVIKHIPGVRTYVSVDGGMSDNPRPALYQARYEVIAANKANQAAAQVVTLAGKHCECDILISDIDLPELEPGDIVAVQTTGAYNYSMASNYNRFTRPAAVLVGDGRAEVIVERESYEDLIRQDRLPDRLRPSEERR
jgi:diaminopimelate decarboxylase